MTLDAFTTIYTTTLLTLSTVLALATAYLTRKDRADERAERFVNRFVEGYERVSEAIIELVEAGDEVAQGRPPIRFRVARLKLRDAIDRTAVPTFVAKAEALTTTAAERVADDADAALDEVRDAIQRGEQARKRPVSRWRRIRNAPAIWMLRHEFRPYMWLFRRRMARVGRKRAEEEREKREIERIDREMERRQHEAQERQERHET